jgi:hypothetical protein
MPGIEHSVTCGDLVSKRNNCDTRSQLSHSNCLFDVKFLLIEINKFCEAQNLSFGSLVENEKKLFIFDSLPKVMYQVDNEGTHSMYLH